LHEPTLEQLVDADSTVAEVRRLKAEGKLRYIGLQDRLMSANGSRALPALAEVLQLEVPISDARLRKLSRSRVK